MPAPVKPASKPLSKDEFMAMNAIATARRQHLQTMFGGARVVYGHVSKGTAVYNVRKHGKAVNQHATELRKAITGSDKPGLVAQARAMVADAVGIDMPELVGIITSEAVEELVKEMTPYVGLFTSAGKAAIAWKQVIEGARAELGWDEYTTMILPGDPLAACDAVRVILKRNIARSTTQAGIHTTALATKIAGMAGDMGSGVTTTVIGLASGLASLAVELTQLGIDIREMKAGNLALESPGDIDKSIFTKCPLLGSYFIARSPTSMVLGFFVADIGLPGWMNRVEEFKRKGLDPIIEVAADQITRSRITVEGVSVSQDKAYKPHEAAGKVVNWSWTNFKFQFHRQVRARLPF